MTHIDRDGFSRGSDVVDSNDTSSLANDNDALHHGEEYVSADSSQSSDSDNDDDAGSREVINDDTNNPQREAADSETQPAEGDVFVPPDDDLALTITKQAEQLFSDEGLAKESYLLKHIKRNKLGFVSIKVFNSLRKMKRLTRDYRAIAYSIQCHSTTLELNENQTKIRRKVMPNLSLAPVSASEEKQIAAEFRTAVVANLPASPAPTIESVAELFSKCGPLTQIRVVRPGSTIDSLGANLARHLRKHDGVGAGVGGGGYYALVEFESVRNAKRACKKMTDKADWRHGLSVTLLAILPNRQGDNGDCSHGNEDHQDSRDDNQKGDGAHRHDDFKRHQRKKKRSSRVDELAHAECSGGSMYSSSGSDTEGRSSRWGGGAGSNRRSTGSPGSTSDPVAILRRSGNTPKSGNSPARGSPLIAALQGRRSGDGVHDSDSEDWRARSGSIGSDLGTSPSRSQSPWALRRLKAQQDQVAASGSAIAQAGELTGSPGRLIGGISLGSDVVDNVVRQPRGPDGSNGFKSRAGLLSTNKV